MNINDFYNKKSLELGWEDFGDFLDRMTVANIRDCVFLWTKEYADLVNEQTKQPEKALVINGVSESNLCACGCGRKTKYKFSGLESCREDFYSR